MNQPHRKRENLFQLDEINHILYDNWNGNKSILFYNNIAGRVVNFDNYPEMRIRIVFAHVKGTLGRQCLNISSKIVMTMEWCWSENQQPVHSVQRNRSRFFSETETVIWKWNESSHFTHTIHHKHATYGISTLYNHVPYDFWRPERRSPYIPIT